MPNLSDVIRMLPAMKSGQELVTALEVLPECDPAICTADAPIRLMALSDLYRIYVPSQMSLEIYSKLYLAITAVITEEGYEAGSSTAESELQSHYAAGVQRYHGWL